MLRATADKLLPTTITGSLPRPSWYTAHLRGVPLAVIAAQLGHADTRMVEKHYGHLAPSYIADTVRQAFGSLGIVESTNVAPIASAR